MELQSEKHSVFGRKIGKTLFFLKKGGTSPVASSPPARRSSSLGVPPSGPGLRPPRASGLSLSYRASADFHADPFVAETLSVIVSPMPLLGFGLLRLALLSR